MGRCEKRRVGRVLVTRKRGRKRFEDCDSIENSLRSVDPWGRIGWRQWKESFSLMTKPKWLPLIWPPPFTPRSSRPLLHRSRLPIVPPFSLSLSLSLFPPLPFFVHPPHSVYRVTQKNNDRERQRGVEKIENKREGARKREEPAEKSREACKDRSPVATATSKIDAPDRDRSIFSDTKVSPDVLCITVKLALCGQKLRKISSFFVLSKRV